MPFTLSDLFFPAFFACLFTAVLTPIMVRLATRFTLIDDPKRHKHPAIVHTKPIPRGGGVPIYLGIMLASLLFIGLDKTLTMILLGGLIAVVIGLLDDKYDLSPYTRFVSNFVIAIFPVLSGISILFITNPLGGNVLSFEHLTIPFGFLGKESIILVSDVLSLLWIVWTMNMLNWSTGVDGQMPGIAFVAAVTIGILSLRFVPLDEASVKTAQLSFITAGAALGFLFFNFPKARIFPGYGGTVIGFMLAVVSILSSAKVATALLVMGVPTVDAIFTMIRRIFAGRSPFKGDRGHFHHLLLKRGWSTWQVAVFYWISSALLGSLALTLLSREKLFALIVLAVVVGGSLLWLSFFPRHR